MYSYHPVKIFYGLYHLSTRFQIFDRLVKLNFRIIRSDVHQALRIDEGNVLFILCIDPQDVVWIEVSYLEETHTNLALVAEQIQRLSSQFAAVVFNVGFQMVHKTHFVCVQCHRRDLYLQAALFKAYQWGIQM